MTNWESTSAWNLSGGAVRKYSPRSGVSVSSVDVFAGENIVTPALVTVSRTLSVTADDAAPTITSAFSESRRATVFSLVVGVFMSPESPSRTTTSWPSTPPAALISSTASCTPANSGGPR